MDVKDKPRQGQVNEPYFIYLYNNYIERAFITALRVAFNHPATPAKYRYDNDINISQCDIRSDYPQRITKLPIIIVTLGAGDLDITYLGDEFMRKTDVKKDGIDGYLYGGQLKLKVNINIWAGSKRDIEHLSDIVGVYVRYLFREKFLKKNIAYTKIGNLGISADEENVGGSNRNIFKNIISTDVTTEFTHYLDRDLYETIQSLNFQIGTYYGEAPEKEKEDAKKPKPPSPY